MNPFAELPKVELHLHLEGSIEPAEVRYLARQNRLRDAEHPLEYFTEQYHYRDFLGFLLSFKFVTEHLVRPEDFAWATRQLVGRLQAQTVIYAEVFLSAGVALKQRKDLDSILRAVSQASRDCEASSGVVVNWILDITRQFGAPLGDRVVDSALRARREGHDNVVAVGMGGDENSLPAREYQRVFAKAREQGLHVTIHAGEIGGPQSIREALDVLGAERIGHGIAAHKDEQLMDRLRQENILLECALTSNIKTGAIPRLNEHPLRKFLEHGVPVCLNSDDPALFSTSLTNEYLLAEEQLGLTRDDFLRMNRMALEHSFAAPGVRDSLLGL